jgi:hypothetical protein
MWKRGKIPAIDARLAGSGQDYRPGRGQPAEGAERGWGAGTDDGAALGRDGDRGTGLDEAAGWGRAAGLYHGPRQSWETGEPHAAQTGGRPAPGESGAADGGSPWRRIFVDGGGVWPLLLVVVLQVVLSLRLVGLDTAFMDEAEYLWAGHLEWSHWLHGGLIPPFAAYFSGAPVLYPPLGALADSLGGLVGARVLSLLFMMGATCLLWGAASRLWGRAAAFFSAALFAVSGPVLHVGAFATFDAMSVFFLATAVWLVVAAGERHDATWLMVAAGAALAVASASSYASVLVDPVVVAIAWLAGVPRPGGKAAAGRCVLVVTVAAVLLGGGLLAGGTAYLTGFEQTVLSRVGGMDSPWRVITSAWAWTGLVAVVAWVGVVIGWAGGQRRPRTWLLTVLAVAVLLVPAEQARLHSLASLDKHTALGLWFAAIPAGYAVSRVVAVVPAGWMRFVTCGACVTALAFPVTLGAAQSRVFSTNWPNAYSFTSVLRPLAADSAGRLLVEDPSIAEYYLHTGRGWTRWSSTRNIVLPSGASTGGPAATAGVTGPGNRGVFAEFITNDYFSLVALNFADTTALDHAIAADLRSNPRYRITQVVPYGLHGTYVIWQREPAP